MKRSIARRCQVQLEQLDERLCLSSSPGLALSMPVQPLEHGVTVLAWARIDGTSPLQNSDTQSQSSTKFFNGRLLTADDMNRSATVDAAFAVNFTVNATLLTSSPTDDVIVDGQIITGENYDSVDLASNGYIRIKKLNSGG